ncbi:hypothetical protein CQW23_34003 [Capsicum baccatum]|uniref:Protein TAR1 n=1 Tax=Capsicum baccatum TaxID=33114 RepID=A0A2G2V035_CAPBA|nr:hypothetical protein CQW23_34003 [Capsicum baccatum]
MHERRPRRPPALAADWSRPHAYSAWSLLREQNPVLAAHTKAPPHPKSSASSPVVDDTIDNRHERTMKRRRRCYTGTDGSHGLAMCHGAMVPWCLGAMAPRCLGALVPWRHGAMVPWCLGAMTPRCLGAMEPRCQADLVPRCTDIQLDKDTTMAGHYTSVGVRHWRRLQHCTRRSQKHLIVACLHAPIRIPLVRTSSELAVRRAGKALKGTIPSSSPGRHAATRSRRGSSSSSPPTADGFGTGTPVPSPQSQSFSRSYGSILPTSLAYIVPSTRGCSPWRPNAVMSTTGCGRHSVLRIFKVRWERTGHHATCGAPPAAGPYLWLSRFQGVQAVKQKI